MHLHLNWKQFYLHCFPFPTTCPLIQQLEDSSEDNPQGSPPQDTQESLRISKSSAMFPDVTTQAEERHFTALQVRLYSRSVCHKFVFKTLFSELWDFDRFLMKKVSGFCYHFNHSILGRFPCKEHILGRKH